MVVVIIFLCVSLLLLILYNFWEFIPEDSCIKQYLAHIGPPADRRQRYRDVRNPASEDDTSTEVELSNLREEPDTTSVDDQLPPSVSHGTAKETN